MFTGLLRTRYSPCAALWGRGQSPYTHPVSLAASVGAQRLHRAALRCAPHVALQPCGAQQAKPSTSTAGMVIWLLLLAETELGPTHLQQIQVINYLQHNLVITFKIRWRCL